MATSRLKKMYNEEIVPNLMEKLQFKSIMQVPKINKISIKFNYCFNRCIDNYF